MKSYGYASMLSLIPYLSKLGASSSMERYHATSHSLGLLGSPENSEVEVATWSHLTGRPAPTDVASCASGCVARPHRGSTS